MRRTWLERWIPAFAGTTPTLALIRLLQLVGEERGIHHLAPIDVGLERADDLERLQHLVHRRVFEAAAAPILDLDVVLDRALGYRQRQLVVSFGEDLRRLFRIGIDEVDALHAAGDDRAQLIWMLLDELRRGDSDGLCDRRLLILH